MILGRLRRVRRISALAAFLCTVFAAFSARDASITGERWIHEPVVATVDMISAARFAVVDVGRSVHSHDRSAAGPFVAPHDAPVAMLCAGCRSVTPALIETLAAPRPRRLTLRYEATAPPSAL